MLFATLQEIYEFTSPQRGEIWVAPWCSEAEPGEQMHPSPEWNAKLQFGIPTPRHASVILAGIQEDIRSRHASVL